MTSINTNLSSLIVQKNLTKSTNALNQAVERLTTGFKINHASDNAANYSISESMTSKLSSYMVAEENTSMGLDLIRTQSSTLDTIQNLTTRLRALAEQAHNGTYGSQSLEAINQEAGAIIDEITRIGNNAEYNGIKLFDNALSQAGIPQLKSNGLMQEIEQRDTSGMTKLADVDETETLAQGTYSISSAEELAKLARMQNSRRTFANGSEFVLASDIDLSAYSDGEGWKAIGIDYSFRGTFDGNGYKISNLYINSDEDYGKSAGLFGILENATIKNLKLTDVNISAESSYVGGIVGSVDDYSNIQNCSITGTVNSTKESGQAGLIVGRFSTLHEASLENCYSSGSVYADDCVGGIAGKVASTATDFNIVNCYSDADVTGSNNSSVGGIAGCISCLDIINSGFSGKIKGGSVGGGIVGEFNGIAMKYNLDNVLFNGSVEAKYAGIFIGENSNSNTVTGMYDSSIVSNDLEFAGYDEEGLTVNVTDISSQLQVGVDSTDSSIIKFSTNISLTALNGLKLSKMEGNQSLEMIDNLLSKLSEAQTKLGAIENRLTSTIESIGVNIENLTSSRSTLKDADVAKESSQMIKNQILQQASATLLATANQTPALALRLLGGM